MTTYLATMNGDFEKVCLNVDLAPSIRAFYALTSANFIDTAYLLNKCKPSENDSNENLKWSLCNAANHWINGGNRSRAVEILRSFTDYDPTKTEGPLQDFYNNLWVIYLNFLNKTPDEKLLRHKRSKSKFSVFGDSHLFGMACDTRHLWSGGAYIPGIRYPLIASPQDNHKKVAIRNAFICNYESEKIIISIGEIDTRLAALSFLENPTRGFKSNNIEPFIEPAFKFISDLTSAHQEITIVLPPSTFKVEQEEFQSNVDSEISHIVNKISKQCRSFGFKTISYPNVETILNPSSRIDHAHFQPSIYAELLNRFTA